MSLIFGLLLVIVGAFSAGTSSWPYKTLNKYKAEHTLFVSQIVGMFLVPWIILFCVCNVGEAFNYIGLKNIFIANIFSFVFGIGNILSITCLVKIGFVMQSILGGVTCLVISTLIPFIFKGSGVFSKAPNIFSPAGIITILAVCFAVASIILISIAGGLRDEQLGKRGVDNLSKKESILYKCLSVLSGFFVPCLMLLNTYYGPILSEGIKKAGCIETLSSLSLWTFGMVGCIVMCAGYAICLIIKNKSFKEFNEIREFIYATCSGVQYVLYLVMFGFGSIMIGAMGATIGNGVCQCIFTGGQQFIGFAFGEWKGVNGKPVRMLVAGLIFLLIGIVLLSLSSYFNK